MRRIRSEYRFHPDSFNLDFSISETSAFRTKIVKFGYIFDYYSSFYKSS